MGIEISEAGFSDEMYRNFSGKLRENLAALKTLLARPGFGLGEASLGAEMEMYIIDADGRPLFVNQQILDKARDPQLTLELNRYNLEYNLSPFALSAQPFRSSEAEVLAKLAAVRRCAAEFDGRIVLVGILPTLVPGDFGPHSMSNRKRYEVLADSLGKSRGENFQVNIDGADPLRLKMQDVTLEGANTSFQIHYRVAPRSFADTFNAVQLVTPLVLAISANSPGLFGHELWQETRIPLFKQSIDTRIKDRYSWHQSPRVGFGTGWVREGAFELFAESVLLYPPFFPVCGERQPLDEVASGLTPALEELRLHQSSVWLWNRPVYDNADDGHLRIEMRALPAGPTAVDMVANAALFIGLAEGLRPQINALLPALPFALAEYNFYRAAQHGLAARLVWPDPRQTGCHEASAHELLQRYLPLAHDGLRALGVSDEEASGYLGVIERRLAAGQTGANWQRNTLRQLGAHHDSRHAAHEMLGRYYNHSLSNTPVGEWN